MAKYRTLPHLGVNREAAPIDVNWRSKGRSAVIPAAPAPVLGRFSPPRTGLTAFVPQMPAPRLAVPRFAPPTPRTAIMPSPPPSFFGTYAAPPPERVYVPTESLPAAPTPLRSDPVSYCPPELLVGPSEAAQALAEYARRSRQAKKVFQGPLFSTWDLNGAAIAADPVNRTLPAGPFAFFQTPVNSTPGQGFTRSLTYAETDLDGAAGHLPSNYEYVSTAFGIWLSPYLAIASKDTLLRFGSVRHVRSSNVWQMGSIDLWPCAEFGHQSKSVATTIANSQIQYGVNGAVQMRRFAAGGAIYFPAQEQINVTLDIWAPWNVTTDGGLWNGGIAGTDPGGNGYNAAQGAIVKAIFDGWRFETLSA